MWHLTKFVFVRKNNFWDFRYTGVYKNITLFKKITAFCRFENFVYNKRVTQTNIKNFTLILI